MRKPGDEGYVRMVKLRNVIIVTALDAVVIGVLLVLSTNHAIRLTGVIAVGVIWAASVIATMSV